MPARSPSIWKIKKKQTKAKQPPDFSPARKLLGRGAKGTGYNYQTLAFPLGGLARRRDPGITGNASAPKPRDRIPFNLLSPEHCCAKGLAQIAVALGNLESYQCPLHPAAPTVNSHWYGALQQERLHETTSS